MKEYIINTFFIITSASLTCVYYLQDIACLSICFSLLKVQLSIILSTEFLKFPIKSSFVSEHQGGAQSPTSFCMLLTLGCLGMTGYGGTFHKHTWTPSALIFFPPPSSTRRSLIPTSVQFFFTLSLTPFGKWPPATVFNPSFKPLFSPRKMHSKGY